MISVPLIQPIPIHPKASEAIVARLSEMIADGVLRPGERLVQAELAKQFGVSRLPVRDALKELEQRSLVADRPPRGVVVRPIRRKDIRDSFAMRRLLEPVAAVEALARVTEEDMARLETIVELHVAAAELGDMASVMRYDQEFHDCLNARAENEVLKDIIAFLWPRVRQARNVVRVSGNTGFGLNSARRHQELMEAIRRRDADAVRSAVVEHISIGEREFMAELERLGWVE